MRGGTGVLEGRQAGFFLPSNLAGGDVMDAPLLSSLHYVGTSQDPGPEPQYGGEMTTGEP